jgi:hypothetical protein
VSGFDLDILHQLLFCTRGRSRPLGPALPRQPTWTDRARPARRRLFADVMELTCDDMPTRKQADCSTCTYATIRSADGHMVEQSGELHLLILSCYFPHARQPLGHALPALRRVRVRLASVLLDRRVGIELQRASFRWRVTVLANRDLATVDPRPLEFLIAIRRSRV